MRKFLAIGFFFIATAVHAGGPVNFKKGTGGGAAIFRKGTGGGTVNFQVGLIAPSHLVFTVTSSNTITATWTGEGTPTPLTYTFQVSSAPTFAAPVTSSVTANQSGVVSALSVNTLYFGEVRGETPAPPGTFSSVQSTATLAVPPLTVASTWTSVTSSALTFNWAKSDNPASVTQYEAKIGTASDFTGTLTSSLTYNLSATFSGLTAGGTYYGEVRALNLFSIPTNYFIGGSTVTTASACSIATVSHHSSYYTAVLSTNIYVTGTASNQQFIYAHVANLSSNSPTVTCPNLNFVLVSSVTDSGGPTTTYIYWSTGGAVSGTITVTVANPSSVDSGGSLHSYTGLSVSTTPCATMNGKSVGSSTSLNTGNYSCAQNNTLSYLAYGNESTATTNHAAQGPITYTLEEQQLSNTSAFFDGIGASSFSSVSSSVTWTTASTGGTGAGVVIGAACGL